ncbi:NOL1/NOP2/sun family protein isoform X2 [Wolffia australiana]
MHFLFPFSLSQSLRRARPLLRSFSTLMGFPPSESSGRYTFNPTLRWNSQVEEYFIKAYGAEHFAKISGSLTQPSSYSCIRVNFLRSSGDDIIEKLRSVSNEMNDIDQAAGSMEDQTELPVSRKQLEVEKCQFPELGYVIFVRGTGPHSIQYNDSSIQPLKEIIVSRKCAEAVLRGAQVFVPGVLACSSHVEKGDTVAVSVAVEQPRPNGEWATGITRGTTLQGLESDPQYHERKGLYIGQGIAMISRAGIFRVSEGIAVDMSKRIYNLPSFHNVLEGEIFLQNLPSIVTAHVLDPREGERILDMCAAPGGKTTAIAALMHDKGEVIALDRSHNKVIGIQKLAKEMGLICIHAYKQDALKAVKKEGDREISATITEEAYSTDGEKVDPSLYSRKAESRKTAHKTKNGPGKNNNIGGRVESSKGFSPNSFDRVLLDAPCSALGLRPRLFAGEETLETLRNHGKYQRRMFDQAVQLVRPGGVIVYSTCTLNPGENEALVRYALDRYKFLSLVPQHPRIAGPGLVGRCELFNGEFTEEWLTEAEAELVQRFDPSSSLDTIGFFIAKFIVGEKSI